MRFPRLFDKGSLRRTAIAVGVLALVLTILYAYQPLRFDIVHRKPVEPLARVPIHEIGLFETGKRIVLVTAHPDDEAFYVGGTLIKLRESGAQVSLIVVTDGDKSYYPFHDSSALRKTRRLETEEVARRLGIAEVLFLGYPDGRLSFDGEIVTQLAREIRSRRPDIVLGSDPYYWPRASHRDHRVAGELTEAALKQIGFDGWALYFSTVAPNTFSDVGADWMEAQELLGVHKSQFYGEKLNLIKGIVSEYAVQAGEEFGVDFAEPFRAVRAGVQQ